MVVVAPATPPKPAATKTRLFRRSGDEITWSSGGSGSGDVRELVGDCGGSPRRQDEPNPGGESSGAEMDALFREEMAHDTALLDSGPHAGIVGAFEGANYESHGYFRPQSDCIMFTRAAVGFCLVCRRAIDAILDLYTKPAPA